MRYAVLNLLLAIILSLNIFIWQSPVLGVVCGVLFLGLSSWLVDKKNLIFGLLKFLSIIVIVLSVIYYFYELNDFIIVGFLVLFGFVILWMSSRAKRWDPEEKRIHYSTGSHRLDPFLKVLSRLGMTKSIFLIVVYLLLLTTTYFFLEQGSTLESVRTPWALVSKWFFVLYFITSAWLIFVIMRLKAVPALILSSLHLFFTFSIVNIIFPLGFGYDPFIHQATEKYILERGFILPKPFYYLGQYSLVIFFTKIFHISHTIIDKNLVPLLSSILLPMSIYFVFKDKKSLITHYSLLITFLFLLIPFSILTFTTPQNLADLLVIILAFLGLSYLLKHKPPIYFLTLLAVAILFIHPIAGLAGIIFIFILWLNKLNIQTWLRRLSYVFLCFSAPIAFALLSFVSRFKVGWVNNFNLVDFFNNSFRFFPDLYLNTLLRQGYGGQANFVHLITTIAYFLWQPLVIFLVILFLSFLSIKYFKNKLFIIHYSLFIILVINSLLIFSF
ncbi:hypothetical protein KKC16_02380, partial [Patescibacteria group bacterium]|nr:hypothetical protein [Patescibacteria group bacterium]